METIFTATFANALWIGGGSISIVLFIVMVVKLFRC
jgi:hypothetical protein